jgi:hypothetical protein
MVTNCGMVNNRGQIAWTKIGRIWKVSTSLIRRWLNRLDGDYYKADFAAAVEQATEALDLGKVKRDAITAAGRHFRHKTVREIVVKSPMRPRAVYGKKELVIYAAAMLKPPLRLDPRSTKPAMLLQIDIAIKEQTTRNLQKVRTESQECMGEGSARALVVANVGPEDDRWVEKTQVNVVEQAMTDEQCEAAREYARRQMK